MSRLFIAVLIMLSSACSVTPKGIALHDFGVESGENKNSIKANVSHSPQTTKSEINVDTPSWLINDCIRYRLLYASPTQLRCYNLDKWVAPPAELFKRQLQASGKLSKYRLMIQLLDFEQQFDTPKQARVVLHFVADAYPLDSDRLIATQDFRLTQVTPSPDATGAVAGFAHLTQQAADKLQQWLISLK
jgi:cholesterol transport system auxiliary component